MTQFYSAVKAKGGTSFTRKTASTCLPKYLLRQHAEDSKSHCADRVHAPLQSNVSLSVVLLQLCEPLNSFPKAHCILAQPCNLLLSCCDFSLDLLTELLPDKVVVFQQPGNFPPHLRLRILMVFDACFELLDCCGMDVLPFGVQGDPGLACPVASKRMCLGLLSC